MVILQLSFLCLVTCSSDVTVCCWFSGLFLTNQIALSHSSCGEKLSLPITCICLLELFCQRSPAPPALALWHMEKECAENKKKTENWLHCHAMGFDSETVFSLAGSVTVSATAWCETSYWNANDSVIWKNCDSILLVVSAAQFSCTVKNGKDLLKQMLIRGWTTLSFLCFPSSLIGQRNFSFWLCLFWNPWIFFQFFSVFSFHISKNEMFLQNLALRLFQQQFLTSQKCTIFLWKQPCLDKPAGSLPSVDQFLKCVSFCNLLPHGTKPTGRHQNENSIHQQS